MLWGHSRKFESLSSMTDHHTSSSVIERLSWRYAVKQFDASRKINAETWTAIEHSLVLAPSSFGLQPWKFVVITDQKVKDQLPPISWNQTQPRDCSHMVVLAARRSIDEAYVERFMQSVVETRNMPRESLNGYYSVIVSSIKKSSGFHLEWNARQVYIALGQLMLAASFLHVDSCPMEGIDTSAYDKLLGLNDSDYTTVVACALGYRSPDDKYAHAPKVRFDPAEVIKTIG